MKLNDKNKYRSITFNALEAKDIQSFRLSASTVEAEIRKTGVGQLYQVTGISEPKGLTAAAVRAGWKMYHISHNTVRLGIDPSHMKSEIERAQLVADGVLDERKKKDDPREWVIDGIMFRRPKTGKLYVRMYPMTSGDKVLAHNGVYLVYAPGEKEPQIYEHRKDFPESIRYAFQNGFLNPKPSDDPTRKSYMDRDLEGFIGFREAGFQLSKD